MVDDYGFQLGLVFVCAGQIYCRSNNHLAEQWILTFSWKLATCRQGMYYIFFLLSPWSLHVLFHDSWDRGTRRSGLGIKSSVGTYDGFCQTHSLGIFIHFVLVQKPMNHNLIHCFKMIIFLILYFLPPIIDFNVMTSNIYPKIQTYIEPHFKPPFLI